MERNDVSAVVRQLKVWCGLPDRQSWAEIPGGDHPLRASRGQRSSEAIFIGELLATHGSKCSDSVDLDMIQAVGIGDKALGPGKNFRRPTKTWSERPKVFVVVRNESCDRNHQLFLIRSPGNVLPEVRQSLR